MVAQIGWNSTRIHGIIEPVTPGIHVGLVSSTLYNAPSFVTTMHRREQTIFTINLKKNQRLPGACNRSPGSKLLSITTQLHCGGHLGGRARLQGTTKTNIHVGEIVRSSQWCPVQHLGATTEEPKAMDWVFSRSQRTTSWEKAFELIRPENYSALCKSGLKQMRP